MRILLLGVILSIFTSSSAFARGGPPPQGEVVYDSRGKGGGGGYPGHPGHPGGYNPVPGGITPPRRIEAPKEYQDQLAREAKARADAEKAKADKAAKDAKDKIDADTKARVDRAAQIAAECEANRRRLDEEDRAAKAREQVIKDEIARPFREALPPLINQAKESLARHQSQFTPEAYQAVDMEVQFSEMVSKELNTLDRAAIPILGELITDKVNAVNDFLAGVAQGTYDGAKNALVNAQQVAEAIYKNPTVLNHISTHIMNSLTNGDFYRAVEVSIIQLGATLAYGNAYDKGHALGEFASNMVIGMAAHSQIGGYAGLAAFESIAQGVKKAGSADALGAIIQNALRKEAALAPALAATQAKLESVAPLLNKWRGNHKITSIKPALAANQQSGLGFPPYKPGSHVVYFTTKEESNWVRVHKMTNEKGSWVMRQSAIKGLSPEQIRTKFAIPETPTHVSNVKVPGDTPMSRGSVQYHRMELDMPAKAPSGAIQYHLEKHLPDESFTNARPL